MLINETFLGLCLAGKALAEDIDDYVSLWHKSDDQRTLQDFLGFTDEEYKHWVKDERAIRQILFCRKTGQPYSDGMFDTTALPLAARTSAKHDGKDLHTWIMKIIQN